MIVTSASLLNRRADPKRVMIGLALVSCCLLSEFRVTGLISVGIMACYCLIMANRYTIVFLKYLYFFFAATMAIVGCAVIEYSSLYLPELRTSSFFAGALPLQTLSYWLLIETIITCDSSFAVTPPSEEKRSIYPCNNRSNNLNNKSAAIILGVISLVVFGYMFIRVLPNPAFLLGVDRFNYGKQFNYGFIYNAGSKLANYLVLPCIVLIVNHKCKLGALAIAIFCFYSFWVGNKFGVFFSLLCYFAMIYAQNTGQSDNYKKVIRFMIVGIAVLVVVAVFAASFIRTDSSLEYLKTRLAQQGQLWWKTYESSECLHVAEISDEVNGVLHGSSNISDNVGADYGIYKVMYRSAPKDMIDSKLSSGSRYTEAGLAAMYYYFGVVGCVIFAIVGGVLASLFVNLLLHYLNYSQYLCAFLVTHMYMALKSMLSSFVFFGLLNLLAIIGYIVCILCKGKIFKYDDMLV